MNQRYSQSTSAYLLRAALVSALGLGGISTFFEGEVAAGMMSVGLILGFAFGFAGIGFGLIPWPRQSFFAMVIGGVSLFLYALGIQMVQEYAPGIGVFLLVAAGLVALSPLFDLKKVWRVRMPEHTDAASAEPLAPAPARVVKARAPQTSRPSFPSYA